MSLNGLNNTVFPLTLDGTTSLDLSSLTIDGANVDLSNLVPYQGANQTLDMGAQNIRTTHVPATNPDVVNKQFLDTTINNLVISIAGSFLDKVTATPQTVIGNVSYTAQLSADNLVVPETKEADLGGVVQVSGNHRRTESDAGVTATSSFGSITNSLGVYQATSTANFATLQLATVTVGKRYKVNINVLGEIASYTSSIQLYASTDGISPTQSLGASTGFIPGSTIFQLLTGTFVPAYQYIILLCVNASPTGAGLTVKWFGLELYETGVELEKVTLPLLTASKVPIINSRKQLVSSGTDASKLDFLDNVSSDIQTQLNGKLNLSGSNANQNIVIGSYKVQSTATPSVNSDYTTKLYVDSEISGAGSLYLLKTGGTMTGDIVMGANKVTSTATPTTDDTLTRKGYVDAQDATKLNLSGGTMNGNIIMGVNTITTTANPTTDDQLTRKGYVDTQDNARVLKAGDTMTGELILNKTGRGWRQETVGGVRLESFVDATAGWLGTFTNHPLYFYTNNSNQLMALTTGGELIIDGLTANRVLTTNGSKGLASSTVTTTTLSYLDIGSSLTGLLNAKSNLTGGNTFSGNQVFNSGSISISSRLLGEPDGSPSGNFWIGLRGTGTEVDRLAIAINGNQTTGVVGFVSISKTLNLGSVTANRVLILDASNNVGASTVTPATLAFLDATSSVQTQLNGKLNDTGDTVTGTLGWSGANVAEFGVGVSKEANAGKIGYNWVAGAGLEIVGGGTTAGSRAVVAYDRLGVGIAPVVPFQVSGVASVSGNVGIGTTNPLSVIHINASGTHQIRLQSSSVDNDYITGANDLMALSANLSLTGIPNVGRGSCQIVLQTPTAGGLIQFLTGNAVNTVPSERMRITGAGNVGIGTTNPATALHIARAFTANADYAGMISFENTSVGYYEWQLGPQVISNNAAFSLRGGSDGFGNLVDMLTVIGGGTGILGIGTNRPDQNWAGNAIPNAKLTILGGVPVTVGGKARISLGADSQHYSAIEAEHTGSGGTTLTFFTCKSAFVNGSNPTERLKIDEDGQLNSGVAGNTLYNLKFANSLNHISGTASEALLFAGYNGHIAIGRNTTRNATTANLMMGVESTEESQIISVKTDNSGYMPLTFASSRYHFASGYVGIGVPSSGTFVAPLAKFTINSTYGVGGENSGLCINATDNSVYNLRLYPYVQAGGQVAYQFRVSNQASVVNSMVIGYNGNIGIGTTQPSAVLDVYSTTADYTNSLLIRTPWSSILLDNSQIPSGRKWSILSGGNGAGIGVGNFGIYDIFAIAYRFVINSSGNVGIGTQTPAHLVNWVGNVNGGVENYGQNLSSGSSAYTLMGVRNNTPSQLVMFLNSSTRTGDGGVNTGTLRNDAGSLRLQSSGGLGITIQATDGVCFHAAGDGSYMRYGPNTTWGSYLHVGATQNKVGQPETAQVITTNGNIHIDAGWDRDIYLGLYPAIAGRVGTNRFYGDTRCINRFTVGDGASRTLMTVGGGNNGTAVGGWFGNIANWPDNANGTLYTQTLPSGANSAGMFCGYNSNSISGYITCLAPSVAWITLQIWATETYVYYNGALSAYTQAGGWVNVSDEREKEDIQPLKTEKSLERVLALRPTHYRRKFNDTVNPVPEKEKEKRHVGFIAQEVQKSNPHCISTWCKAKQDDVKVDIGVEEEDVTVDINVEEDDGSRLGMMYNDITVHLVGAVQEQQKQIVEQQKQIDVLTERNKVLEAWARDSEAKQKKMEERMEKMASLIAQLIPK